MMGKKQAKANEDQFENEFLDPTKVLVEVKVSDDEGETWQRRKICMVAGLDESGLHAGEMFQFNGEKFKVTASEDGLDVEQIKRPEREKSSIKKQPVRRR